MASKNNVINKKRKKVLITHARQSRHQQVRQTGHCGCVFADFLEELYTSSMTTHEHEPEDKYEQLQPTITPFMMQELNNAINQKRQRCRHKRCQRRNDQTLHQKTRKTATTTAQQNRRTKGGTATKLADMTIIVIYSSGAHPPSNYWPVCSIPILCKLCSQLHVKGLQTSVC